MSDPVEVFADITCPFTHVGLKQVVRHLATLDRTVEVFVRAWPLEWVNGAPLGADAVLAKAQALSTQLDIADFSGLNSNHWPTTTIPALNLAAAGYALSAATGLAVSLDLRTSVFEEGSDISDPQVLAEVAARNGIQEFDFRPEPCEAVQRDYNAGQSLGVSGSPHFWVGDDNFFCPALDLGHDEDGNLTARFDTDALAEFFKRIDA